MKNHLMEVKKKIIHLEKPDNIDLTKDLLIMIKNLEVDLTEKKELIEKENRFDLKADTVLIDQESLSVKNHLTEIRKKIIHLEKLHNIDLTKDLLIMIENIEVDLIEKKELTEKENHFDLKADTVLIDQESLSVKNHLTEKNLENDHTNLIKNHQQNHQKYMLKNLK